MLAPRHFGFARQETAGVALRWIEYDNSGHPASSVANKREATRRPPAALIAARLIAACEEADKPLVHICLSETSANRTADALRCLNPGIDLIVLPPWDCLPYDRVPPSRQCMGRRMDALRVWSKPSPKPRLLLTSLDAVLQRIPPASVVEESWFELKVGEPFYRHGFEAFVRRTGYVEDAVADEPGEIAFRGEVVDIFPAGATAPMRILLDEDGLVSELRSYDPSSQRTEHSLPRMVFGPASEAILSGGEQRGANAPSEMTEVHLFKLYGEMRTVFDVLDDANVSIAPGIEARLDAYLDVIADAGQAVRLFGDRERQEGSSLYLSRRDWTQGVSGLSSISLDVQGAGPLPDFAVSANPLNDLTDFVVREEQSGRKVVVAGHGSGYLCRRLERRLKARLSEADNWAEVVERKDCRLFKLSCSLDRGFMDPVSNLTLVTVGEVLGYSGGRNGESLLLTEPELRLGDVVVHENHGIGILADLESLAVDGVVRAAARLEYRDSASVLVPMEEFGKLWRYGSEPQSVTLDRLHTDAWAGKRAAISKEIRSAARHLKRLAKERSEITADSFVPARADYDRFARRFPYAETADQAGAVEAVLQDLRSGKAMNRLICGDVGFGKTEVALRAAAAVALAGGQVVVIAPTTVLARQHLGVFERRFSGTKVKVAMLSRLVSAGEAKEIKAELARGEIGIVVATQAILAKDVAFARLGLLIVDEEHRFGIRDKQAMRALAPSLHMLAMSATPIPRTLQTAMIGIQDVSLLTTPPSKRMPVRTSFSVFDRASMRIALMRERRRGGQSFIVVPRIEDLGEVEAVLRKIVPDFSIRVAHGKMPAGEMDDAIVGFADGEGDVLLSTNIIENGLDVPRANTIFIWRSDRFGLAQLHQLRGRVGRGKAQGVAYLLVDEGSEIAEETRLRLATLVENDRLGSGLSLSMRDLDLRGGGDLMGEDQAGHMKVLGVSLYQKLLERAIGSHREDGAETSTHASVNLGVAGTIPAEYVPDATVRLNLYARLLKTSSPAEVDELAEEFEDRFGDLPEEVSVLLRITKLQIAAARFRISKLDAGPRALAITFAPRPLLKVVKLLAAKGPCARREDRLVFEQPTETGEERMAFFETLLTSD